MGRILSSGVPDPGRHEGTHIDHVSHAKPGIKTFPDKLYVIAVISNPVRYRVRYELYRAFEKHMEESGVILYTVEMAFGDRHHEITNPDNPHHVQLRSKYELWHKENLINIGIQNLPADWGYVAWIDTDIVFQRPDWAQETIHQLQHYDFVQLFSHAQDLGPNYEPLETGRFESFCHSWDIGRELPYKEFVNVKGFPYSKKLPQAIKNGDMKLWHPGYAWAARRSAIDHVGGLIDWAILGSGDHNMATALIGKVECSVHPDVHPNFMNKMRIWQDRAERYIRRNIGCVDGLISHMWHGKKANRGYVDRWQILVKNKVDPETDLKRDWQGLWQLVDHGDLRSITIRDQIRKYFRQRMEDGIEV